LPGTFTPVNPSPAWKVWNVPRPVQRRGLVRRCGRQAALPNSDGGLAVACASFARRHAAGTEARALGSPHEIARFLRDPQVYPLFAKPIAGKYSLSVLSGDRYDAATDEVLLLGGERRTGESLADLAGGTGYVIQRRLDPDARLARLFGPRLWSFRALVRAGPSGPVIHRAMAKIATGNNPADNFWRQGNMLVAIEIETGIISRVVRGTGAEMSVNEAHPGTKRPIVGTLIPQWAALTRLVISAAEILPGIRTQSWEVALAAAGPVLLEVNYGGDLNLAQLAHGAGVLDERYVEHLARCGYRSRALREVTGEPSRKSRPVISTSPSSVT
jgi:Sugar-transfer associated ATP-grasp